MSVIVSSAQSKRLSARREAEAHPRADAVGVLARHVDLTDVVIRELPVIRDVGEVLEDLLARAVDDDAGGDRVHRRAGSYPRTCGLRRAQADLDRVPVLGVADELAARRLATVRGAAQLADDRAAVVVVQPLSGQRRAAAVGARLPVVAQLAERPCAADAARGRRA